MGVHCPECTREARQSAPRTRPAAVTALRRARTNGAIVTYSLVALTLVVFVLQKLTGGWVTYELLYAPLLTEREPWRMLTAVFVHSDTSFLHILFNMYSLFIFGRILEPMLGWARFLALYLLSGFGGSVAVLLISPLTNVVGASGAIFGLLGAFFVIQRGLGGNNTQLMVLLAVNLGIGFVVPGIAWQAHIGGLIVGAVIAFIYLRTRRPAQARRQWMLVAAVAVALVAITLVGVALLPSWP